MTRLTRLTRIFSGLLLISLAHASYASAGDITVANGSTLSVKGDVQIDMNCGNISVTGGSTLDLSGGTINGPKAITTDKSSTLIQGGAPVTFCDTPAPPPVTTGTIILNITPDAMAGSWNLSGPSNQTGSGDKTMESLPPGSYQLTWPSAPAGWVALSPLSVELSLEAGTNRTIDMRYLALDADNDGTPDFEDTGDTDKDGFSDAWETAHNLDPALNQAKMDRDNDGFSDLREILSGTNPLDASSKPALTTLYVKPGGTGLGTSWNDAMGDLQQAINYAAKGETIRLMAGVYRPSIAPTLTTAPSPKENHFVLKAGITLEGGYSGNLASPAERNILGNKSILSGDVNGNDVPGDTTTQSDNLTHVIILPETLNPEEGAITLDGIVITAGWAGDEEDGGGILQKGGKLRIVRSLIKSNRARKGGGIFVERGELHVISSVFAENQALKPGGAIYLKENVANGIHGTTFYKNTNESRFGGGGSINTQGALGDLKLTSSIFWGSPNSYIANNEFEIMAMYWPPYFPDSSTTDPIFTNADAADYRLQAGSPAIDSGSTNDVLSTMGALDMGLSARFDGTMDRGAFEFPASSALVDADDADSDGLSNGQEKILGTNPRKSDTDNDGMADGYENTHGLNPLADDRWLDKDGDGYVNLREAREGTSASDAGETPPLQGTWYVSNGSSQTGTGKTPGSRMNNLQNTIFYAHSGETVSVATGIYVPTSAPNLPGETNPRLFHFSLKNGVTVKGEGSVTLSGNSLLPDVPSLSFSKSTCHIFYHPASLNLNGSARLENVTIASGYSNLSGDHSKGAAMLNIKASPTLFKCIIRTNNGNGKGIITNINSAPTLVQCLMRSNYGPAMVNQEQSSPRLINTTLTANSGGIVNDATSSVHLDSSIVWGNGSEAQLSDSGTESTVLYSMVGGSRNPLFTSTYGLSDKSPAIHAGNPSPETSVLGTTDLAGENRTCGTIDMGPYENLTADTDCNGVVDASVDSDGDGLTDKEEDPNGNGVVDAGETDPNKADTNGNGTPDGQEDPDGDGLTNLEEVLAGTDPNKADSDGDGVNDAREKAAGTNPMVRDTRADNDGDGFSNLREIEEGTAADNSASKPITRRFYVKPGGATSGLGSSWDEALGDLQRAMDLAGKGEEIWVANGTYRPATSPHRPNETASATFHFAPGVGVRLFGGFTGSETDISLRNPVLNPTLLEGDPAQKPTHVIWHKAKGETIVDGFTITGGDGDQGGGVYNEGNLTLRRCRITGNNASSGGGGIASTGSITLENTLVAGNTCPIDFFGTQIRIIDGDVNITSSTIAGDVSKVILYAPNAIGGSSEAGSYIRHAIVYGKISTPYGILSIDRCAVVTGTASSVPDAVNITENPLFTDPASGDYTLKESSPCRNAAEADASAPEGTDLAGNKRVICRLDYGAFEYQAEPDRDGDGTPDCTDGCPDDGAKLAPGCNGCGTPDVDTDGDGILDCKDDFPTSGTESEDTDKDGQGDNSDPDDDNDGMPDAWEITNNLDPKVDDSGKDRDGDGITNLKEYRSGTNPGDAASRPARAEARPPAQGITPMAPILKAQYSTGIRMGQHVKSRWQIAVDNTFADLLLDIEIANPLYQLGVPRHTLEENTRYCWRVVFDDDVDIWSEPAWITTGENPYKDANYNGLPDDQEVFNTNDAPGVIRLKDEAMTLVLSESDGVEKVEQMSLLDPTAVEDVRNKPSEIPQWFAGFQARVPSHGDEATFTFTLETPVPDGVVWAKYDAARGWQDAGTSVSLDATRTIVTVTVRDGGPGDADGVANGVVVDPIGPSTGTFPEPVEPEPVDPPTEDLSSSNHFNCFINSLR